MAKQTDANIIDYMSVKEPTDKPFSQYNYIERRANLLRETLSVGSSRLLNRTKLADKFNVAISTISRDIDRVDEYMANNIDETKGKALINTAFTRIYHQLLGQGELKDAWKVLKEFKDYLHDIGVIKKEAEQIEHVGDVLFHIEPISVDDENDEQPPDQN